MNHNLLKRMVLVALLAQCVSIDAEPTKDWKKFCDVVGKVKDFFCESAESGLNKLGNANYSFWKSVDDTWNKTEYKVKRNMGLGSLACLAAESIVLKATKFLKDASFSTYLKTGCGVILSSISVGYIFANQCKLGCIGAHYAKDPKSKGSKKGYKLSRYCVANPDVRFSNERNSDVKKFNGFVIGLLKKEEITKITDEDIREKVQKIVGTIGETNLDKKEIAKITDGNVKKIVQKITGITGRDVKKRVDEELQRINKDFKYVKSFVEYQGFWRNNGLIEVNPKKLYWNYRYAKTVFSTIKRHRQLLKEVKHYFDGTDVDKKK